ncbi:hypothetical protein DMUE_6168 [Dictyocoela muelleri]|nr:hypothetical protein DMUE_6168 [Dictyocoela muelleri]
MKNQIKFLKGQRNSRLLLYCNYIYNLDKKCNNNKTKWKCKHRSCSSRLILTAEETIFSETPHVNHEKLSEFEIITIIAKNEIKEKAFKLTEKSSTIVTSVLKNYPENIYTLLPTERSLTNSVSRVQINNIPYFIPSNSDIPETLHFNLLDEKFFRFDS